MHFFSLWFTSGGFQPHGYCYQWNSGLVWLHVISDTLVAASYFTIPFALLWFIRKRRDLPFSWMFALFGLFITACGITHVMEIWNLWNADYWLAGAFKAVTAAASVGTAVLLVKLLPGALALPTASQWTEANKALEKEVQERRMLELQLRLSEIHARETAELVDLTHGAIVVRTLQNEIIFWNKAAEKLYGWQRGEVYGKSPHEVLHTVYAKSREEIETEILETGYWEGELIYQRRDGTPVVVSSRWAVSLKEGKPTAILESNRDITLRKQEVTNSEIFSKPPPMRWSSLIRTAGWSSSTRRPNECSATRGVGCSSRKWKCCSRKNFAGNTLATGRISFATPRFDPWAPGLNSTHYAKTALNSRWK